MENNKYGILIIPLVGWIISGLVFPLIKAGFSIEFALLVWFLILSGVFMSLIFLLGRFVKRKAGMKSALMAQGAGLVVGLLLFYTCAGGIM